MCLQIGVVFKAHKLSIQLTWGDRINPGHHGGENQIEIFVETGKEISDHLIIVQRCIGRREFISAHHGVVIRDRELVLLGGGKGDMHVDGTRSSLRGVEVSHCTPHVCCSRTPRHMH
jgi:hypothetical protein